MRTDRYARGDACSHESLPGQCPGRDEESSAARNIEMAVQRRFAKQQRIECERERCPRMGGHTGHEGNRNGMGEKRNELDRPDSPSEPLRDHEQHLRKRGVDGRKRLVVDIRPDVVAQVHQRWIVGSQPVGVEAFEPDAPFPQVAIDVVGQQRRREEQRRSKKKRRDDGNPVQDPPARHAPRKHHHARVGNEAERQAGDDHGRRQRPSCEREAANDASL